MRTCRRNADKWFSANKIRLLTLRHECRQSDDIILVTDSNLLRDRYFDGAPDNNFCSVRLATVIVSNHVIVKRFSSIFVDNDGLVVTLNRWWRRHVTVAAC